MLHHTLTILADSHWIREYGNSDSLVSAQVYFLYIICVPFIDPWEPDMTSNAVKTISATL